MQNTLNNVEDYVNNIVNSKEFINYVDEELFEFANGYVKYILDIYPEPRNRLTKTQARGMLNISAYNISSDSVKANTNELKKLCSNRKSKETNESTKEVWEKLFHLFDISKDTWKQNLKTDKKSPKEFIEANLDESFTKDEKNYFKNLLFAHILHKFCIHFYSEYIYIKALRGERS